LDNYQTARTEQQTALAELESLSLDLAKLEAQAEAKRLEADRYLEWRDLSNEAQALEAEAIPRLEVAGLLRGTHEDRDKMRTAKIETRVKQTIVSEATARLAALDDERKQARQWLDEAKQRGEEHENAWLAARDRLRDIEKLLNERSALRERVS